MTSVPASPSVTGAGARPVRLQLSRKKGFDIQALSLSINGLAAVKVSRPGLLGNVFTVTTKLAAGTNIRQPFVGDYIAVPTAEDAVACYDEMLEQAGTPDMRVAAVKAAIPSLRNHNLACWCRLCPAHAATGKPFDVDCPDCAPCHGDVLGRRAAGIRCVEEAFKHTATPDQPRGEG